MWHQTAFGSSDVSSKSELEHTFYIERKGNTNQ